MVHVGCTYLLYCITTSKLLLCMYQVCTGTEGICHNFISFGLFCATRSEPTRLRRSPLALRGCGESRGRVRVVARIQQYIHTYNTVHHGSLSFLLCISSTPALRIAWLNMLYVWNTITPESCPLRCDRPGDSRSCITGHIYLTCAIK